MKDYAPAPSPMRVGEVFQSLTEAQILQFYATVNIITSLLMGIKVASQTEDENNIINRKEK